MAKNVRLTIGEFSKFCKVTTKTLKHYEKLGLLVPSEVDEWTGYRYYDVSQMQQMNGILRLKAMGFTLEEIGDLFDEGTHKPSIGQIEEKIIQAEQQIRELQERLATLRNFAETIQKIDSMGHISIQRLPPIIVASHRSVIRRHDDLGPLCANVIGPEITRIGCKRTLPVYCFEIEHETEYKPENIDIEYCEQVEEMLPDTELIKFKRLPEVPMAVCIKSYGPYENMQERYIEVFNYIDTEGYKVTGQLRTVYVDGRWNQKDPKKWLTIIQVPVTKDEPKPADAL